MGDILKVPLLGRFLKWKHSRTAMQSVILAIGLVILFDGFFGPQLSPRNVAGVSVWVHWRGFVILALLIAGNLFCMACPFMLVRKLSKKLFPANKIWPSKLHTKWLAALLLIAYFWSYEVFDLWASPWWTAWVAVGYFLAAFIIDGIFKGATFCKNICPIGQFHFVNSLGSPLEIKVKDQKVCASCKTKDCIKGRYEVQEKKGGLPVLVQNGCELNLFQERKVGNMDCTFCLDCVKACPYDNIGMVTRKPFAEIWADKFRSSIGYFKNRPDFALLVLVMVFGSLVNALGMISPIYDFEVWMAGVLGTTSEPLVLTIIFLFGMLIIPVALMFIFAYLMKLVTGAKESLLQLATHYSYALVPIGFGMWAAHYMFHFFTGALIIFPVLQDFFSDFGLTFLDGIDMTGWAAITPDAWNLPIITILLALGLAGSLMAIYKITEGYFEGTARRIKAAVPWYALAVMLFSFSLWIMRQPMEMRGVVL